MQEKATKELPYTFKGMSSALTSIAGSYTVCDCKVGTV